MRCDRLRWLIAGRHHDERDIGKRGQSCHEGSRLVQCAEVIRHRSKTFRLAPERLHDGKHLRRQFPDLADEPLQRTRGGRSEDLDEIPGNAGCATAQQREARADDTEPRQERADARQLDRAPEATRLLSMPAVSVGCCDA